MPRITTFLALLMSGAIFITIVANAFATDSPGIPSGATIASAVKKPSPTPEAVPVSGTATEPKEDQRELLYDASILEIRSELHGIARPQKLAVMSALVAGRILTIHQEEGAAVTAGDRLVSLDDRLEQAQVDASRLEAERTGGILRAEQAFKIAERRLQRLEQAALKNAAAGFEIEEAKSLTEQARAEHTAALETRALAAANLKLEEEQLRRGTICAPFDGVVVQIHQKAGTTVDPTLPIVTIASLETLEVEMYVPVERYGTLKVGGQAQLISSAPVSREIAASVRSVSPVIDSASNTFRCVMVINNSELKLPAGFSVVLNKSEQPAATPIASKEHQTPPAQ